VVNGGFESNHTSLSVYSAQFWPYLKCAVSYGESLDPREGDSCAIKAGMDVDRITSCRVGPLGRS